MTTGKMARAERTGRARSFQMWATTRMMASPTSKLPRMASTTSMRLLPASASGAYRADALDLVGGDEAFALQFGELVEVGAGGHGGKDRWGRYGLMRVCSQCSGGS